MNMRALPVAQRKAIALLLAATLAVLVMLPASRIVQSFVFEFDDRVAEKQAELARMVAISQSMPQLRSTMDRLQADIRYKEGLYPPVSDAQAAAALQADVREIIDQAGATVRSIQAIPTNAEDGARQVAVRVIFSASTGQFNRSMEGLHFARPAMFIGAAEVVSSVGPRRTARDDQPPQLQATLDVYAYLRGG